MYRKMTSVGYDEHELYECRPSECIETSDKVGKEMEWVE